MLKKLLKPRPLKGGKEMPTPPPDDHVEDLSPLGSDDNSTPTTVSGLGIDPTLSAPSSTNATPSGASPGANWQGLALKVVWSGSGASAFSAFERTGEGGSEGERRRRGSVGRLVKAVERKVSVHWFLPHLLQVYRKLRPEGFKSFAVISQRRCLTEPSEQTNNFGMDNCEDNLIVHTGMCYIRAPV